MKKSIHLYLALSLFSIFYTSVTYAQPITDGLIGYWPFDGNANDISGNGNNGVVNGAQLVTDKDGNTSSAYSFDGQNDYIELADADMLSFGNGQTGSPFSFSFWLKPTLDETYHNIIGKWNQQINTTEYVIWYNGDNKLRIDLEDNRTNYKRLILKSNSSLKSGIWQNITITYNGSRNAGGLKIYFDGVLDLSGTYTTDAEYVSMENTSQNLRFGRHIAANGDQAYYKGAMDEIRLYNRVLSQAEIGALYNSGGSVTESHWQKNDDNIFYVGKVAVNRSDLPVGYDLAIDGKIVTKEVKVTLADWPDYVFESDYDLLPLIQLEETIAQQHHLPNIPSSKDVLENGIELGQMDAKLLQKIEELTLYLIEQNKEIQALKKEMAELKSNKRLGKTFWKKKN